MESSALDLPPTLGYDRAMRSMGVLVVLLAALLACKASSGGSPTPAASASAGGSEANDEAAPVGKFATFSLKDFEARAQKARWKVLSSHEVKLDGSDRFALELDDSKHYAYVTVIDLGAESTARSHAARMGQTSGIVVEVDGETLAAKSLLEAILAKKPVDNLSRDAIKEILVGMKWEVASSDTDSEDGVSETNLDASKGEDSITVVYWDFSRAQREGRAAVDGDRIINVFVCKDCTQRKTGAVAQAWQNAKAKRLLGKLTN
jgi:hypothetical protein